MQRTEPPIAAVAVCLAALAGFVDALAFVGLGGFFASFMSGNSTRLGVGLATAAPGDAVTALALVLAFVSGVIFASVVSRALPARQMTAVMALVTGLLTLAAVLGALMPGTLALLLLAMAMGAENGAIQRDGETPFGLTYMTGSLVRMGQRLAGALMGDRDRWGWLPYLALWAGFVAGVTMGALAYLRWDWSALWFAALASAALTLLVSRLRASGAPAPR